MDFPDRAGIWVLERPERVPAPSAIKQLEDPAKRPVKWIMAKGRISLALNLGLYLTQDHQETALVQPLGGLSTYVWTTYYQTPGFMSEAIPGGPNAAGKADP